MIDKETPFVSVIILNYNNAEDTIACLESVFRQTYDNYNVILCDNGSTDNSLDTVIDWTKGKIDAKCAMNTCFTHLVVPNCQKPIAYNLYKCRQGIYTCIENDLENKFTILMNDENLGFGAGNNAGINLITKENALGVQPKYIWFLNNDIIVKEDALEKMVRQIESDEKIAMTASVMFKYKEPERTDSFGGYLDKWGNGHGVGVNLSPEEIDNCDISKLFFLSGSSVMMSVRFLQQVGLFDERFQFYYEEADFAERAYRNGWLCALTRDSIVWHKGGGTTSQEGFQARFGEYHGNRSKIIFMKKYYPWRLTYILLNEFRKLYHLLNGKYPKSKLQGIIDGIKS